MVPEVLSSETFNLSEIRWTHAGRVGVTRLALARDLVTSGGGLPNLNV